MSEIKTITAISRLSDAKLASEQIYQQLNHQEVGFILFYCSSAYSLPLLSQSLQKLFAHIKVVGCTTAGEVSSAGNLTHSIVAIGFSSHYFSVSTELITSMADFNLLKAQETINTLNEQCLSRSLTATSKNTFLLTLLDGLSAEEEHFLAALNSAAAGMPHFGGSAGADDAIHSGVNKSASNTHVYFDGHFLQQAAVVIMVSSRFPFEVFSCDHISKPKEKLVVTDVDALQRTVYQLNAEPAALEYARLLNLEVEELCPTVFALNPLAVKIGDEYYIRAIQKVNEADLSLTFYCAVDIGIVLTAVEMGDTLTPLIDKLQVLSARYGKPQLVLACDCVLRSLEIEQKKLQNRVQSINSEYQIAGFNSYGEHINGIHLNQTFTGVYIADNSNE